MILRKSVTGLRAVTNRLRNMAAKAVGNKNPVVAVGYSTDYALRIHEDLMMPHIVGQALFLIQPARTEEEKIKEIVLDQMKTKNKNLAQALIKAGEYLKVTSQALVPVDTGMLKRSAYVTLEQG